MAARLHYVSVPRKGIGMGITLRSGTLRRSIATAIACIVVGFPGCISSRSLIEGLAKTPLHPVQATARYASMNSHQQDFLYFTETVRETHPEPFASWSKEEFDREQHRMIESLDAETSKVMLEKSLQSFLSHIQDSHTNAYSSWAGGQPEYPVSFIWVYDTLILASVGREEDTTLIGSRVLSFNAIPADEVFTRFTRFITYGNVYEARRTLRYYFVFPAFHRDAGIIDSDTLELTLLAPDGTTRSHRLVPIEKPKRISFAKSNPITEKVNRPFRYTILKKENVCYLQWNSMVDVRMVRRLSFPTNLLAYPVAWYMGIGYFDNFLEDMFEEMKDEGVTTLVVDVRGNGGGSSGYGEQLLYYLDVPPNSRDLSMAIRFSPLYREFYPGTYADYAASYSKKYAGKKLPDSLIVISDFMEVDSSKESFFQNVTDAESDYHIKPNRTIFEGKRVFSGRRGDLQFCDHPCVPR